MEPVQTVQIAEFEALVRRLRKQAVLDWSEETAKHAVVVEILKMLGWSPFEMEFEVKVGSKRNRGLVDIKLYAGKRSVLVECKKPSVDLDNAVGQLFEYAFYEGARLAVLTNGVRWDLYLPYDADGSARERRFASIGLQSREAPADLFAELHRFLEHSAVKSGKAERNAKERLKAKQRGDQVKDAMPVVWKELLDNPPNALIELIENGVQRRIGHVPKNHQVREFLLKRGELTYPPMPSTPVEQYRRREPSEQQYASTVKQLPKSIQAFTLWGQRTEVETWAELILGVASILHQRHTSDFTRAADMFVWINLGTSGLRAPRPIPNSPYFIGTRQGRQVLASRSRKLLEFFGYPKSDLIIESNDILTQASRRVSRMRQDFSVDTGRASAASISAFVLWGQHTAVASWVDLLVGVTTIMYQRHGNDFDHMTKKMSWLSRNRNILKKPNVIPGSPFYVNSYAGAKVLEARCRKLLKIFGHSPDDLQIIE
ncbi:MAG: type I restriction enzyme HsdR N-terminal domain-containing protein [Deltaproteobacteria bacterium]|nr:type I restriction enzyme HsdR N-terminal domain-containing protein [Deltaproteobacteria bacterium]